MKKFTLIASSIILLLSWFHHALAYADYDNTIKVVAEAGVHAVPEQLKVQLFINETNVSAANAKQIVDAKTKQVLKRLASMGLDKADIGSFRVNINPQTERDAKTGGRKQVGFVVSREINIIIRDWTLIDKILDSVVALGVNQIGQIQSILINHDDYYQKALLEALNSAKQKAEALVKRAGKELGEVVNIEELGNGRPMLRESMSSYASDSSVSRAGRQLVNARIVVIYEIN